MKRSVRAAVLCAALVLSGCGKQEAFSEPVIIIEETLPAATVPADGEAHDVTCKGTYTGTGDSAAIIARMEGAALTNEELQAWYQAEVKQYQQSGQTPAPDFEQSLDTQPCPIDSSVNSWQQYFLKAALNRWHTAHALIRHSQEFPLPLEEAYTGDPEVLNEYMTGMPATELLYGYDPAYRPNSLHQAYLDSLPSRYDGPVLEMAQALNYGYMYFTTLSYDLETPQMEAPADAEPLVSFRHILLLPEEGQNADACIPLADELVAQWMSGKDPGEASFAQLASGHSQDPASAQHGGGYTRLRRDQLPEKLARWCFDDSRREGDTTIVPMDYGAHILYFIRRDNASAIQNAAQAQTDAQTGLLDQLRQQYPMEAEYRHIFLTEQQTPSLSELLYPDIAHERFPEVPLYLQQNYDKTMYGEHKITTNGCGITSLAMLASYMTDDELTPPEMCARYGRYSRPTGTSGALFEDAPPQLGFYLIKKTYDWREAREYMREGHPVIVCQYRGYWTSGGHYLVLETLTEDGMVRVRDSNLYNYRKLIRHKDDKFPWDTLIDAGQGYWIYEKKATSAIACIRCGDPDSLEYPIVSDYLCEKCRAAQLRRESYLSII